MNYQDVVKLQYPETSIVQIIMEDKQSKNTFSSDLIQGLMNAFETIRHKPEIKIVVIQGYENYFCCGGTQEELLKILEGKMTFADLSFYRLLLDCEAITIAAMQGHALGGGLAFGAFADFCVLGEECIYSTNFMKYGFTPGMGATYIIPKKFGETLGHEMLFSARNYFGNELKNRGVQAKIVKKQEVISTALAMARELNDKPSISLRILKQHFTEKSRFELPAIIEKELEMHNITFKQDVVKEKIELLFGN